MRIVYQVKRIVFLVGWLRNGNHPCVCKDIKVKDCIWWLLTFGYTHFISVKMNGFVVGFRISGGMELRVLSEEEICHVHVGIPGQTVNVTCNVGGPTHARYVYVYLPGTSRYLMLCEVQVFEFTGSYLSPEMFCEVWISRTLIVLLLKRYDLYMIIILCHEHPI